MSRIKATTQSDLKALANESLEWDVYSQKARDAEVHLREDKIESIRFPILSQGFAVRVVRPRERGPDNNVITGIGIGPGISIESEDEVRTAIEFAKKGSKFTGFPEYIIPSEQKPLPGVKIVDHKIETDLVGAARQLAEEAISLIGIAKNVRFTFCKIRLTEIETVLENCNGLHFEKQETFAYFEAGLSPLSKVNNIAEYWPHLLRRRVDDLQLEQNMPKWAKFSLDSLKARAPETGNYSLVASSKILSEMLPPVVSFHASASALKKNMSRWKNPGKKVWSDKVTILDDGLLDYGILTSAFDDEGTPQQRTGIIQGGEFQNYLSNRMYSSCSTNKKSTGNGVKGGRSEGILCYGNDVDLKHTNIVMKGGDSSLDEMIEETRKGLLVEQFAWMVPEALTGNFGAEIRHAYLIESGEVTVPLKGGVLNGSFFDTENASGENDKGVFSSLDYVSKEIELEAASMLPSVRFPTIRVSGT